MKARILIPALLTTLILSGCVQNKSTEASGDDQPNTYTMFNPLEGKVILMNLAPGHFHASLVQKTMYDAVDPRVYVFAPEGPEVQSYLNRIQDYNQREEDPTAWEEEVYTGEDFLDRMLSDKPGNVMVTAGNNARKTEYIMKAVDAGIHVLADKPMVISPENFSLLEKAFSAAAEKGVLLYDIMTERHEITTKIQKELSRIEEIFGELQAGSLEEPAITKESVHHFSKIVSGKQLVRPAWFFDTRQQGEGIVDVTTHLVDLVQWEAFPEVILSKEDVEILSASRWTTDLDPAMFEKVTSLPEFPDYLNNSVEDGILKVYSNGEINYKLKGIHAKVSVIWNFEAPPGTGDTHYSVMRGSKCKLIIRQGEEEGYRATLYIAARDDLSAPLSEEDLFKHFYKNLAPRYPGIVIKAVDEGKWRVDIPEEYKVGHEAHFGQVTELFLDYLASGRLPAWEIPNMIVKYYTTTEGMKKAMTSGEE